MTEETLKSARAKLRLWQEAYYNLDPQVSDQEYDALADWVRRQDPEAPELKKVGAAVPKSSLWEKVTHKIPMGSLDKVNTEKEFEEWTQKSGASWQFFVTHKIDGSSMELVYEAGKLIQCVTRGDGIVGEDVTENVKRIPNVPNELKKPVDVTIRGEVVMFKDVFKKFYADEYANPRNTAAGKVRKKGGEDCLYLSFLAYGLHGVELMSMTEVFFELEKLGFETPEYSYGDVEKMKEVFSVVKDVRDDIPYEIDGLVVSINDMRVLEELGDLNMRPRGQIAWKFDAQMGITRMVNVRWQVGPSGRVTPVADIEPVKVGGVTITSITLHNLSIFNDLKLWPGCRILVSRRNDVIPYIEKNLDLEEI
jgi:DNA ligase (NAD+)